MFLYFNSCFPAATRPPVGQSFLYQVHVSGELQLHLYMPFRHCFCVTQMVGSWVYNVVGVDKMDNIEIFVLQLVSAIMYDRLAE